jgi:hypothetical protein
MKEGKYNLYLVSVRTIFWLLVLSLSSYLIILVGGIYWPKILAFLYPYRFESDPETSAQAEFIADTDLPLVPPTPSASVSSELLVDLLQAILAANPPATASGTVVATNSGSEISPD